MKNPYKTSIFYTLGIVTLSAFFTVTTFAQSALNPNFWNNNQERIIGNCTYRNEYNPYTNQVTRNEVCNPKVVSYNAGSAYNNNYTNNFPNSRYVNNVNYSYPTVGGVPGVIMNTFGISYPIHNYSYLYPEYYRYGYLEESMFDTYYRGGVSDYTGYYESYEPYYVDSEEYDYDYHGGYYNEPDVYDAYNKYTGEMVEIHDYEGWGFESGDEVWF